MPEQDLQFLMEIGCSDAQIRAYIGGMVTVPTARAVVQLLVEPAAACTLSAVAANNGKKLRKTTVAAGQDTPSVSERRPPPSGRVPASAVVGVTAFSCPHSGQARATARGQRNSGGSATQQEEQDSADTR